MSLYLDLDLRTDYLHHLTLFSVCGIVEQLQLQNIPVQIKWLNDLILENKKLGGILCETKIAKNKIYKVVIGVGINYNNHCSNTSINLTQWINKNNFTSINHINTLAQIIIIGLLKSHNQYQKSGINYIIKRYNEFLHNTNQQVIIENNQGTILGVNSNGKLQIQISSNTATSNIYFAPENYRISYQKQKNNCYLLTERKN